MGIIRSFKFGMVHNVKDYEPNIELYQNNFNEGMVDASTIHHINNKLIRLGENMNTKTAKNIASKKIKLMKEFIDMFIKETNGIIE